MSTRRKGSSRRSSSWDMPDDDVAISSRGRLWEQQALAGLSLTPGGLASFERHQNSKPAHRSFSPAEPSVSGVQSDESPAELSHEQREIVRLAVDEGRSLFFTGSAGTGKSFVLRYLIKLLKDKYPFEGQVAMTASTGMAACNIGGCTLHSFSGIGLGKGTKEDVFSTVFKSKRATSRWMDVKVLIIDEISMIEGPLFDKIEYVARMIRNPRVPFGGIQLVITGDFMQLPPVSRSPVFCFEANAWASSVPLTIRLSHIFRQRDPVFVELLNNIRMNTVTDETVQTLNSLSRDPQYADGIQPTILFPTRMEVDQENERRLQALPETERIFKALINATSDADKKRVLDSTLAQPVLRLKTGCQVILIKNLSLTLVNGSLGRVLRFDESGHPVVEFIDGDYKTVQVITRTEWRLEAAGGAEIGVISQIPLVLAYALSIHKSQGQTLQRVKVDLARVFEKGQAYVALSRATSLDGLQVLNFSRDKVQAHEKVLGFDRNLLQIT